MSGDCHGHVSVPEGAVRGRHDVDVECLPPDGSAPEATRPTSDVVWVTPEELQLDLSAEFRFGIDEAEPIFVAWREEDADEWELLGASIVVETFTEGTYVSFAHNRFGEFMAVTPSGPGSEDCVDQSSAELQPYYVSCLGEDCPPPYRCVNANPDPEGEPFMACLIPCCASSECPEPHGCVGAPDFNVADVAPDGYCAEEP